MSSIVRPREHLELGFSLNRSDVEMDFFLVDSDTSPGNRCRYEGREAKERV